MKIENKKITTYQICLVALAVGVNIVGGQIALFLKLPVYLDSIGTIFCRRGSGTVVWNDPQYFKRYFYGNDCGYLLFVFCSCRNCDRIF